MPIEIKELVVRATVDNKNKGNKQQAPSSGAGTDKKAIVSECVEQVLEILKSKTEK